MTWEELCAPIRLYAGHIPSWQHGVVGLSVDRSDENHIQHDIASAAIPLPDDSVHSYQSEDVFEHIEYTRLPAVIDEIFRVLEPGGLLRMSMPDYRCDVLDARSLRNARGEIVFDPFGGGAYTIQGVTGRGHVWFPRIESVRALLAQTRFMSEGTIDYLHYYEDDGRPVTRTIDYTLGYVDRTPDHDHRVQHPYRPMSMVIDLRKGRSAAFSHRSG